MSFRLWLERTFDHYDGGEFGSGHIYINPTIDELHNMFGFPLSLNEVRAIVDKDNNVYAWPSNIGTHKEIVKYFQLDEKARFYMYRNAMKLISAVQLPLGLYNELPQLNKIVSLKESW